VNTHNAIKAAGQFLKAIGISVGLGAEEEGVSRLGETLTPIFNPWELPETAYLRGERLEAGVFDVTGGAATIPEVLLFNPVGSRLLGVVTRLHWTWITTLGAFFTYRLFRGVALPGGFVALNSGPVDTRSGQLIAAPAAGLVLAQAANAARAGGLEFDSWTVPVNIGVEDLEPVILSPGTGLSFGSQVVGVQRFIGGIRWRERVMLPGEQARA